MFTFLQDAMGQQQQQKRLVAKKKSKKAIQKMISNMKESVRCEIRPSNVHGWGVSATKHVKKGVKMCVYGGKRVGKDVTNDEKYDSEYTISATGMDYSIDGDRNPKDAIHIGQFINDAVKPDVHDDPTVLEMAQYTAESTIDSNVYPEKVGNKLFIVSKRDIQQDEELFLHYGFFYWYKTLQL